MAAGDVLDREERRVDRPVARAESLDLFAVLQQHNMRHRGHRVSTGDHEILQRVGRRDLHRRGRHDRIQVLGRHQLLLAGDPLEFLIDIRQILSRQLVTQLLDGNANRRHIIRAGQFPVAPVLRRCLALRRSGEFALNQFLHGRNDACACCAIQGRRDTQRIAAHLHEVGQCLQRKHLRHTDGGLELRHAGPQTRDCACWRNVKHV